MDKQGDQDTAAYSGEALLHHRGGEGLCGVKPACLKSGTEQEFTQLRPVKRRGKPRYYQHQRCWLIPNASRTALSQDFTITRWRATASTRI